MFRREGYDEDSDSEGECKYKGKFLHFWDVDGSNCRFTIYNAPPSLFLFKYNASSLSTLVSGPALPPGYKRDEPSSSSDESDQEVAAKRAKTSHAAAGTPGYVSGIYMEEMHVTIY